MKHYYKTCIAGMKFNCKILFYSISLSNVLSSYFYYLSVPQFYRAFLFAVLNFIPSIVFMAGLLVKYILTESAFVIYK